MIKGTVVSLRPVQESDLPLLDSWVNNVDVMSQFNDFGLRPTLGNAAHFRENGMLDPRHGSLLIVAPNGAVAGGVSFREVDYGPPISSRAYNIGIHLVPEHRGHGYGSEAQRLLADYLLSTYPINRVDATTDITNIPEQRSLEKAGFTREGVLRKCQWRHGEWHDMVMYSRIRGDA